MIYGREQFGGRGDDICCGATGVRMRKPSYSKQIASYEFEKTHIVSGVDVFQDTDTSDFVIAAADAANFVDTAVVAGTILANAQDATPIHMEATCIECQLSFVINSSTAFVISFVNPLLQIFVANSPADIANAVFVQREPGVDAEEWTIQTTLTAPFRNGTYWKPNAGPLSVREVFSLEQRYFTRQLDTSRLAYVQCTTQKQNWGRCVPPTYYTINSQVYETFLFHTDAEHHSLFGAPNDGSQSESYMRVSAPHLRCRVHGAVDQPAEWKWLGNEGTLNYYNAVGLGAFMLGSLADRDPASVFFPFIGQSYSLYCSPYTQRGVATVDDTAVSFVHTLDNRLTEFSHGYCVGLKGASGPGTPLTQPYPGTASPQGYKATAFPRILESDALPTVPLTANQLSDPEQALFLGYRGSHESTVSLTAEPSVLSTQQVQDVLSAESGDPANPERKGSAIQYGRDFVNCVRFTGNYRRCTVPTFDGRGIAGVSVSCSASSLDAIYSDVVSLNLTHNRLPAGFTRDKWIALKLLAGSYALSTNGPDGVWLGANSFYGLSNNTNALEIDLTGRSTASNSVGFARDLLLSAPPFNPIQSPDDSDVFVEVFVGEFFQRRYNTSLRFWEGLVAQGKTVVVWSYPHRLEQADIFPTQKLSELLPEAYQKLIAYNSTRITDVDYVNRLNVNYLATLPENGIIFCHSIDDYDSWQSPHPFMGTLVTGSDWSVAASKTALFCRIAMETRVPGRLSRPRLRFQLMARTDCNSQCDEITCDLREVEKDGAGGWVTGQLVQSLPAADYVTARSSAESVASFTLQATDEQSDAFMNFEPITFRPDRFALNLGNMLTPLTEFPLDITIQATA